MNLRNNQISLGELLDHPASRAVLNRHFGQFMNHPMLPMARRMTLAQLMSLAQMYIAKATINQALAELQQL